MNVVTTARHCELDPEVRLFAQERLERIARFVRDPRDLMEAHVVVAAEKYRHSAEITLKLRRGEVVSREMANDPRAAIERAAERLEHQIVRRKEKRVARMRAGRPPAGDAAPPTDADGSPASEGEGDARSQGG